MSDRLLNALAAAAVMVLCGTTAPAGLVENSGLTGPEAKGLAANWRSEGPLVCKVAADVGTGGVTLTAGSDFPSGAFARLVTAFQNLPTADSIIVAVEARGRGRIRFDVFEYEGPAEKRQFARSSHNPFSDLTPEWRWYFYKCPAAHRDTVTAMGMMVSLRPAEGEALDANVRWVSVEDVTSQPNLPPVEDLPTQLIVPNLTAPAVLDGALKDPVWQQATRLSGFVDDKDNQKRVSSRANEIFLFHDSAALYIGMRSAFRQPLVTHAYGRDGSSIYFDDNFELGLLPPAPTLMYQFIANANGNLYDGTFDKHAFSGVWNSQAQVTTSATDHMFTMAMRIPVAEMGAAAIKAGDIWRLSSVRNFRDAKVWYQDHLTPLRQAFADWDRFARLVMAGDAASVDVSLSGCASGRTDLDITPRSIAGTCQMSGNLWDMTNKNALTPSVKRVLAAGQAAHLSTALEHADKDLYRTELKLTRDSDGLALAQFARDFSTTQKLALTTDIDCVKQTVSVLIDAAGLPGSAGSQPLKGLVEIEKKDDPRVITSQTFALQPGESTSVVLSIADMKDGVHLVDCTLRDTTGYLVAEAITPIRLYKDLDWVGNGLGEEDRVPRPFTAPLLRDGVLENLMHRVVLGKGILPAQIYVQDVPLLARPITLSGQINGKPFTAAGTAKRVAAERKSDIHLEASGTTGGVATRAKIEFAYDGMFKIDLEIGAKRPVRIDSLDLRIPLRPEVADVLQNAAGPHLAEGTTAYSGLLFLKDMETAKEGDYTDVFDQANSGPGKWNRKQFWPILSLFNMERGLCWLTESDEEWSVAPDQDRYSIVKDSQATELVIHMVAQPVTVSRWHSTFALQAFPVRPPDRAVEREMWGSKIQHMAAIEDPRDAAEIVRPGANGLFVTNPGGGMMSLETPHMRKLLIMDPWIVMHHAPDDGWQREIFRRTEEFWTKPGRRMFIYNNSCYTWWKSPEYLYFKAAWDMGGTPGQFWEWEMIEVNRANALWQDYWMYHFYQMLKRYPENFFSIDCSPIQSDNRAENNMGYTRDGKRYNTLNAFETRRMYKRMYSIADELRTNPITLLSAGAYWVPMTMSFCSITEGGEEWRGWKRHQFEQKGRSLDYFRYSYAPNMGPIRGFLAQMPVAASRDVVDHSEGIYLLHNLYYMDTYNKFIGADFNIRERMGLGVREDLVFHPYWQPTAAVTCDQAVLKASYWTHPGGASIVIVNTDWDKPTAGNLAVDPQALGLKAPVISLFDPLANTLTPVTLTAGKLAISIPAALHLVVLLDEAADAPKK